MTVGLLERESALSRLGEQAQAAMAGRGRLVLISGEAGIGKTALVRHFVDSRDDLSVVCGYGEPTSTARPLGIVHDIAVSLSGALLKKLDSAVQPWQIFEALLHDIKTLPALPVIWIEDLHWADQATLEALRYLARRCASVRILLIVTLRHDEPGSKSTRDWLLSGVPLDQCQEIQLARLTPAAVEQLATGTGRDGRVLYRQTQGNPLFLMSTLRWGQDSVPDTLARLAQQKLADLVPEAADLIRLLSTHPERIEPALLAHLPATMRSHLQLCIDQRWLIEQEGCLLFQHELLRRAVLDLLHGDERIRLHSIMLELPLTLAQGVHHALGAHDWQRLRQLAPMAAEEAMRLKSFREAAAFWQLALDHTDPPALVRADWYDQLGWALVRADDVVGGRAAIECARKLWLALNINAGILRNMSRPLRWPARVRLVIPMFSTTEIEAALQLSDSASDVSEEAGSNVNERYPPDQVEFDRAVLMVELTRRAALAHQFELARRWLAEVRALLMMVRTARLRVELRWWICWLQGYFFSQPPDDDLDDIIEQSDTLELDHIAAQIPVLAALSALMVLDFDRAEQRAQIGFAYCARRGLKRATTLMRLTQIHSLFQRSRFGEALNAANDLLVPAQSFPPNESYLRALILLMQARMRSGSRLADYTAHLHVILRNGQMMMRFSVLAGAAEIAWLEGDVKSAQGFGRELQELVVALGTPAPIGQIRLLFEHIGITHERRCPAESSGQQNSQLNRTASAQTLCFGDAGGQPAPAGADYWLQRGMPYEAAITLARGNSRDRRRAVSLLQHCGALGSLARLQQEWSEQRVGTVPRGPHAGTSNNPGGLTARELLVLKVLVEGLNNAQIAKRLHRSARTVEHQVSSILQKTGAKSRHDAVDWARRHGIVHRLPD